mmetsp:Transcript_77920/g.238410  ORF Transcript_77920/g.238410 Transcript_77920/m.238410 type:complete len:416 (-) Transcript_77920:12-1259(-)
MNLDRDLHLVTPWRKLQHVFCLLVLLPRNGRNVSRLVVHCRREGLVAITQHFQHQGLLAFENGLFRGAEIKPACRLYFLLLRLWVDLVCAAAEEGHGAGEVLRKCPELHALATEQRTGRMRAVVGLAVPRTSLMRLQVPEDLLVSQVLTEFSPDFLLPLGQLAHRHVLQLFCRLLSFAAQPTLVRGERIEQKDREECESQYALPHLDNIRRRNQEDDGEPNVSEDGPRGRNAIYWELLDVAHVAIIDHHDAERNDHQQVEGGAAHDGAWAQALEVEVLGDDVDHVQKDLGRAGPERHERQVGDRFVPEHVRLPLHGLRVVVPDLLLRDLVDRSYEHVGDDGNAHETPEETEHVQENPQALRPLVLALSEQREHDARAAGVANARLAGGCHISDAGHPHRGWRRHRAGSLKRFPGT